MQLREEYTSFNTSYRGRTKRYLGLEDHRGIALRNIENRGVDLFHQIYKKYIDEAEEVTVDGRKYTLLPMGLINANISPMFVDENTRPTFRSFPWYTIFSEPKFVPFYYPGDKNYIDRFSPSYSLNKQFDRIVSSYREHYKMLDEDWTPDEFYDRLIQDISNYLIIKYAKDNETGEIFAIGFIGAMTAHASEGKYLTNAELYVLPEFRGKGIAKKMIYLLFETAKQEGIKAFDSLTYRTSTFDALGFWQSIGAEPSGLKHISGNIETMQRNISASLDQKRY